MFSNNDNPRNDLTLYQFISLLCHRISSGDLGGKKGKVFERKRAYELKKDSKLAGLDVMVIFMLLFSCLGSIWHWQTLQQQQAMVVEATSSIIWF